MMRMNAAKKLRKNSREDLIIFVLVVLFAMQIIVFNKTAEKPVKEFDTKVQKVFLLSDSMEWESRLKSVQCTDIQIAYSETAVLIEGKTHDILSLMQFIRKDARAVLIRAVSENDGYVFTLRLK